ncbi:hypothetical protein GUITHDRAFT_78031 [Guillardia theta CCMP2712]|uniref:Beta-hexosaminidase n=1 Tax=Guillardia theta (strain CCMP2712) TaxID=905079 RepID=L1IML6_GUITC|nr:hypothetical protein GUITHDRAFT_78031 [Guillardia theta CCMP2712]EKX37501.1 hypothetical protein GUITHDRAFT_78031 [Guillardia theta CCMP2712]|eukprot:XP_005824481.1 hypothetical protein GUITHDRAFT_78031 [Guillardia theta CCMP2712]
MTVNLVPDFKFEIASSSKDLLSLAARYRKICFPRKARWAPNRQDRSTALTKLQLVVTSPDHVLSPHTDESYTLLLPAGGKGEGGRVAVLEASTQFGAMRGLETFSQLLHFDFDLSAYRVLHAPWQVKDKPRFPHRELLVDSARHFLPVRVLKDLLSSLSFAKINVLHWHLADTQSFPMQSRNNPELSRRGSFSSDETYSEDDVAEIVEWGRMRGVRVLPEIDMPGHAASWCRGYPKICPSPSCLEPLSPVMPTPLTPFASDDTFTVVERLMGDVVSSFPEPLLHLGGDEVNTSCWEASESIKGWMKQNNLTTGDAFKLFLLRAHAMAAKFHRRPVVWDEVWDVVGANLSKDVIIQQWRWGGNHVNRTKNVTSNGYQLIWMVDPDWYLDSLSTGWEKIHTTDLCEGLTEEECERVIGGGGGMWGETVDASDLEQTVWPRMAALAEVLWSPAPTGKRSRLKAFRCLLLQRGVRAAPVDNAVARTAPSGPGGCRDA